PLSLPPCDLSTPVLQPLPTRPSSDLPKSARKSPLLHGSSRCSPGSFAGPCPAPAGLPPEPARGESFPPDPLGDGYAPFPKVIQADRKSTRLNSSHVSISYAVFCLKKT